MHIKKAGLVLSAAAIGYVLLEVMSLALYRYAYGQWFSFSWIHTRQAAIITSWEHSLRHIRDLKQNGGILSEDAMHPYLGFVYNKDMDRKGGAEAATGLMAETDPFVAGRDPHNAIVAIAGGSFSEGCYRDSRDVLRNTLQQLPAFKNKKIVMIMLGRGAWKQPQQLFSVAYYLVQGGRLDMLINIDGKNEVSGTYLNYKDGVFPAFPHDMYWLPSIPGSFDLDAMGNIIVWKKARQAAAETFGYFRLSVTASTLWSLLDDYLARQEDSELQSLNGVSKQSLPYYRSGPHFMNNASEKELFEFSARVWEQASRQLYSLANNYHFSYFHFLQPNQYVPDSKPLSSAELSTAYARDSTEYHMVTQGYPELKARIADIRNAGININDLTGIYKNNAEPLYVDTCCHVNKHGYDIVMQAIGKRIADYYGGHTMAQNVKTVAP